MGQYRQWLHYREIDQLLRSQLAVSEHELEQLQAQVEILGKQHFSMENQIFQALLAPQQASPQQGRWHRIEDPTIGYEASWMAASQTEQKAEIEEVEDIVIEEVEEEATISPALLAWSRLPNFSTQMIEEQELNSLPKTPELPPPRSSEQLLPADMSGFIDAHYPTNPQIKIPWWLHAPSDQKTEETYASAPQDDSANYLVQRWFERWGRQSMKTKRAQEDQTHEPGH